MKHGFGFFGDQIQTAENPHGMISDIRIPPGSDHAKLGLQ